MENPEVTQKAPRPDAAKSTLPQPGRPVPSRAYPGALIVVEGTDGSGKSTQLYLLKRWLEIGGYLAPGEIRNAPRKTTAVADAHDIFFAARGRFCGPLRTSDHAAVARRLPGAG
jgi:hypothetical protein